MLVLRARPVTVEAKEEKSVVALESCARLRMKIWGLFSKGFHRLGWYWQLERAHSEEGNQVGTHDLSQHIALSEALPRRLSPRNLYLPCASLWGGPYLTMSVKSSSRTQKASLNTFNSVLGEPSFGLGLPQTVTEPLMSVTTICPTSTRRRSESTVLREKFTRGPHVRVPV